MAIIEAYPLIVANSNKTEASVGPRRVPQQQGFNFVDLISMLMQQQNVTPAGEPHVEPAPWPATMPEAEELMPMAGEKEPGNSADLINDNVGDNADDQAPMVDLNLLVGSPQNPVINAGPAMGLNNPELTPEMEGHISSSNKGMGQATGDPRSGESGAANPGKNHGNLFPGVPDGQVRVGNQMTGVNKNHGNPFLAVPGGQTGTGNQLTGATNQDILTMAAKEGTPDSANQETVSQRPLNPGFTAEQLKNINNASSGRVQVPVDQQPETIQPALNVVEAAAGGTKATAGEVITQVRSGENTILAQLSRAIVDQISKDLQGQTNVRLRLYPAELGEVIIKIIYREGNITTHFQAASEQVKHLIEGTLPQLRETLSGMQFNLQNASVSVGTEAKGFEQSNQQQRGARGQQIKVSGSESTVPGLEQALPDSGRLNYFV